LAGARKFKSGKRKGAQRLKAGFCNSAHQIKFCNCVTSSLAGSSYGTEAWISQLWDVCEFTEKGNLL